MKRVVEIDLTVNLGTKTRRSSYMGITAHYLDENLERKKMILDVKRLKGFHTYDKIGSENQNVVTDFDIPMR